MGRNEVRIRIADAKKYFEIAEMYISEVEHASWKVAAANAVNAGIAAADAMCGYALGYRSQGTDHKEATRLLKQVVAPEAGPVQSLGRLLSEKSLFQYGSDRVTLKKAQEMVKCAERLLGEMRQRIPY